MLCWFFRRMISHAADSDRLAGRVTQRHLSRCQACQQFEAECTLLGQRLRREARQWEPLAERVTRQSQAHILAAWPARLAIAAAILLVIGLAVFLARRDASPVTSPSAPIIAKVPAAPLPAWARLIENPLSSEAQSLADEVESGVLFLVACLDLSPVPEPVTVE